MLSNVGGVHKYCSVLHVHELHQGMGYQLSFKSGAIISLIQANIYAKITLLLCILKFSVYDTGYCKNEDLDRCFISTFFAVNEMRIVTENICR